MGARFEGLSMVQGRPTFPSLLFGVGACQRQAPHKTGLNIKSCVRPFAPTVVHLHSGMPFGFLRNRQTFIFSGIPKQRSRPPFEPPAESATPSMGWKRWRQSIHEDHSCPNLVGESDSGLRLNLGLRVVSVILILAYVDPRNPGLV